MLGEIDLYLLENRPFYNGELCIALKGEGYTLDDILEEVSQTYLNIMNMSSREAVQKSYQVLGSYGTEIGFNNLPK